MTEPKYQAELDLALLDDWCVFCAGKATFDDYHFSTILMGVFLAGHTPEVDDFIRRFSSAFSPPLYNALLRICGDEPSDRDLLPWIKRDLAQKLKLLGSSDHTEHDTISRLLAEQRFTFTDDIDSLPDIAMDSPNFNAIYDEESNYVIDHCDGDSKLSALDEPLYHIANNYALAHAIMSPLLTGRVDLSNYLEIYLRGGDYVVGTDEIVVYQYQLSTNT